VATPEQEGFLLWEIPAGGAHQIVAELVERANPLVAIDQHEPLGVLGGEHVDRQLLPVADERCQNPTVALPTRRPQRLVSAVQLMQLEIHGRPRK
jgi:hypothetical protein